MSSEPVSREKAVTWWVTLFLLSFVGTTGIMWYFKRGGLLVGTLMMTGLFVCWAVLGARVDRQKMKGGVTEGIAALAEAGPFYLIIIVGLELVGVVLGSGWLLRTPIPMALGILAGFIWARQEPELEMPKKDDEDEKEAVDLWKP